MLIPVKPIALTRSVAQPSVSSWTCGFASLTRFAASDQPVPRVVLTARVPSNEYKEMFVEAIAGKTLGITTIRGRAVLATEIARLLRVSERWVEIHMSDGTFPFRWYPINPKTRIADSADIDEWLSKIRVEAGEAPLPKKSVKEIQKEEVMS